MQNVPIVEYSKKVFVHSSKSDLELDYGTLDVLRASLYERLLRILQCMSIDAR